MAVYFISDLHFGSERILSDRPVFKTVEDMDRGLIQRWRKKVNKDDEVYIIGDLGGSYTENMEQYIGELSGKKHLIVGNHDSAWIDKLGKEMLERYFESIQNYSEIIYEDKLLTLCHYPMLEWKESRKNAKSFLLHGHIHTRRNYNVYPYIKKYLPRALNCCPEINQFEPASLEELMKNNFIWYKE